MNMKKLLALLLAIVMVLCLAACNSDDDDDDDDDDKKSTSKDKDEDRDDEDADDEEDTKKPAKDESGIVGTWYGEMDMSDYLADMYSASMGVELEASDLTIGLNFEFKKNGALSASVDNDSAEELIDKLIDFVIDAMVLMYEDQGTDLEAVLSAEGMSMSDFRQAIVEQLDVEDLVDQLGEGFEDGYYIYEDGCVYVGDDKDDLADDPEGNATSIWEVTVKSNKIVIDEIYNEDGESMSDAMPGILPMTLTK